MLILMVSENAVVNYLSQLHISVVSALKLTISRGSVTHKLVTTVLPVNKTMHALLVL